MKRVLGSVLAMAVLSLGLAGCDGKVKQDLAKCQADSAKMGAELNAAKGELDTVKKELADTKARFEALGKEKEALVARVAELEATLAAAQQPAQPEPAKAPAKKPAAKKEPEPKKTSTGATAPVVEKKGKGMFQKK
ncbi:MAG TPA: hypothetical protein PLQ97_10905 [Myxococcota bacterium]|nr:hypothetical protein [Myxococcota bacterium]HQK51560.1 hypothetical protein [Myxococcota bacterium]